VHQGVVHDAVVRAVRADRGPDVRARAGREPDAGDLGIGIGIGSGTDREGASGDRGTTRRGGGAAGRKTHLRPRRRRALVSARENAREDTAWLIACGGQWLRRKPYREVGDVERRERLTVAGGRFPLALIKTGLLTIRRETYLRSRDAPPPLFVDPLPRAVRRSTPSPRRAF